MAALRVQMHLHGNSSLFQCNIVSQRVVYIVHVVILSLQQERRRRLAGDRNLRIQPEISIGVLRVRNRKLLGALLSIPFRCGKRQLSLSAASTAGYKRFAKCVLIAADRCPPAENPSTPILCGSMCHSAACKRSSPTVLCASSNAIGDSGYGPDFGYGPTSVTRYFNSTHVIPLGVSQSQTSVPSKSMAKP